jgi:hypothetical protein
VAIYSAGAGGNYILDATNLLEFLPVTHTWLVTFMSIWWAVGYTLTGLLAWAYMSNFSCAPDATPATCNWNNNWGWRYLHFTAGSLVLVMSVARLLFIRMRQTPRWLISQNRDEEVYKDLQNLAQRYNRHFSLTFEELQSKGRVLHTERSRWSALRMGKHFAGLFETKLLAYSTTMIIANWFVIGMVSPLYSIFLPYYLASRGRDVSGSTSNYTLWRNYAINNIAGPSSRACWWKPNSSADAEPSRWAPWLPRLYSSDTRRSKPRRRISGLVPLSQRPRISTTAPYMLIPRKSCPVRIGQRGMGCAWSSIG